MLKNVLFCSTMVVVCTGCPVLFHVCDPEEAECCEDAECPDNMVCSDEACRPGCVHADCPDGQFCDRGADWGTFGCAPKRGLGGQCDVFWGEECQPGFVCYEWFCTKRCNETAVGADCESGEGVCARAEPSTIYTDAGISRICRPRCDTPDDCPSRGWECGSMQSAGGVSACYTWEMPRQVCADDLECGDLVCTPEVGSNYQQDDLPRCMPECMRTGCESDTYCNYDYGCVAHHELGAICAYDIECAPGLHCGGHIRAGQRICTTSCSGRAVGDSCADGQGACADEVVVTTGGADVVDRLCRRRCSSQDDCSDVGPPVDTTCGSLVSAGGESVCFTKRWENEYCIEQAVCVTDTHCEQQGSGWGICL